MIVARRQVCDPVQGHAAPRPGRDREGREKPIGRVSDDFIPSAGVAASDVCLHIPGVRTHSLQSLEIAPLESVPNSLAFRFVSCAYRECASIRDVSSRCTKLDFVVLRECSPIRVH